jgi:hypothetical protein
VCHTFASNRKTSLGQGLLIPVVEAVRFPGTETFYQVRPVLRGAAQGAVPAPPGYCGMIAR